MRDTTAKRIQTGLFLIQAQIKHPKKVHLSICPLGNGNTAQIEEPPACARQLRLKPVKIINGGESPGCSAFLTPPAYLFRGIKTKSGSSTPPRNNHQITWAVIGAIVLRAALRFTEGGDRSLLLTTSRAAAAAATAACCINVVSEVHGGIVSRSISVGLVSSECALRKYTWLGFKYVTECLIVTHAAASELPGMTSLEHLILKRIAAETKN
jgi:hypothetical protein